MSTCLERYRYRITLIKVLRYLKEHYTYRKLESLLRVGGASVLSRYTTGAVIPHFEKAKEILEKAKKPYYKALAEGIEAITEEGLSYNIRLCDGVTNLIITDILGKRVTKIMTLNQSLIPLSAILAQKLERPLITPKNSLENPPKEYYQIPIKTNNNYKIAYIPKNQIRRTRREGILLIQWEPNEEVIQQIKSEMRKVEIMAYPINQIIKQIEKYLPPFYPTNKTL